MSSYQRWLYALFGNKASRREIKFPNMGTKNLRLCTFIFCCDISIKEFLVGWTCRSLGRNHMHDSWCTWIRGLIFAHPLVFVSSRTLRKVVLENQFCQPYCSDFLYPTVLFFFFNIAYKRLIIF